MTRLVAITGGTCYDCSWEPLVLPDGMNLEDQQKDWRKWYDLEYCAGLKNRPFNVQPRVAYVSFTEWLIQHGAREPRTDELEIYESP